MAENSEAEPSGPQRLRLTKAAIKALRPDGRPAVYWDTELKGLGLKVHPTGRAAWIVQFRLKGDRAAKQPVIGTIADMSPEMARTRAKDLIDAARRGVDLLDQERRERVAREAEGERARQEQARRARRLTVGKAVADTLHALRQQASPRTGRPRSAGYMADQERHLGALAGTLGEATAVEDVDWRAVLRWLKDLSPATRTQAKAAARALIAWLIENEQLAADPLAGRWPKAKLVGRDVTPSPAEVARLLLAAERLALPAKGRGPKATRGDRASIDPVWRDLLHVIALTGCRRSEAAAMRIEDVDLAAGIWRQPSTINKARREHLVPLSVMVADRLPRRSASARAGWYFQAAQADLRVAGHACGPLSLARLASAAAFMIYGAPW